MSSFRPGQIWRDSAGEVINVHGGGLLHHAGRTYWYGECRPEGPASQNARIGIGVYSSDDLYSWKNEGVCMSVNTSDPDHPLTPGCKMERPKCVYSERSGRFVLWWHHDLKGWDHAGALAAYAVSDSPTGPFEFVDAFRPCGNMFRDMTVFIDDDQTGYLVYASDNNFNTIIHRLDPSYETPTREFDRVFVGRYMEAPCVFRAGDRYYFIGSDCTGWQPNPARSAAAWHPYAWWNELGSPCLGEGADLTFGAQSTYVLPVAGKPGAFIFVADRWNPENHHDSRYVWLPIRWGSPLFGHPRPLIDWLDEWDLSVFDRLDYIHPDMRQG